MKYYEEWSKKNRHFYAIFECSDSLPSETAAEYINSIMNFNHIHGNINSDDPSDLFCKIKEGSPGLEVVDMTMEQFLLEKALEEKQRAMQAFWKVSARIMLIKNGHQQPIIADQDFIDNLESAKSQAALCEYYPHQLRNANNVPVFENGRPVTVKMTADLLTKIGTMVQVRRGTCNRALAVHAAKVAMLTTPADVAEYNHMVDDEGNSLGSNIIQIVAPDGSDVYNSVAT